MIECRQFRLRLRDLFIADPDAVHFLLFRLLIGKSEIRIILRLAVFPEFMIEGFQFQFRSLHGILFKFLVRFPLNDPVFLKPLFGTVLFRQEQIPGFIAVQKIPADSLDLHVSVSRFDLLYVERIVAESLTVCFSHFPDRNVSGGLQDDISFQILRPFRDCGLNAQRIGQTSDRPGIALKRQPLCTESLSGVLEDTSLRFQRERTIRGQNVIQDRVRIPILKPDVSEICANIQNRTFRQRFPGIVRLTNGDRRRRHSDPAAGIRVLRIRKDVQGNVSALNVGRGPERLDRGIRRQLDLSVRRQNGTCVERTDRLDRHIAVLSGGNIDSDLLRSVQIVVEFFIFLPGMCPLIVLLPVEDEVPLGVADVFPVCVFTVRHFPMVFGDQITVRVQLRINDQRVGIDPLQRTDDLSFLTFGDLFSCGDPERILARFVFILHQLEILRGRPGIPAVRSR